MSPVKSGSQRGVENAAGMDEMDLDAGMPDGPAE